MITVFFYAAIGVIIILLVALLVREPQPLESAAESLEEDHPLGLNGGRFLNVCERIFDSADYCWLRDVLGRPQLARSLASARKRMAIQWLKTLKASFDDMVRMPEPTVPEADSRTAPDSWRLLWLTLRFHFLLGYALLVVRIFGPYNRLVPSFNLGRFIPEPGLRESRLDAVDFGDFQ